MRVRFQAAGEARDRLPNVGLASDSLERLVPGELEPGDVTGRETLRLHLERYEFAARHLPRGRLLDIACGVGYGTRLLADKSEGGTAVLGIDLSSAALEYAEERYGGEGIEFHAADAMEFRDEHGFDGIVSLETVEHLPDPAGFLGQMAEMLHPGGTLVASVPTTPSVDLNPHHCHDFTETSFRRLLEPLALEEIEAFRQVQPVKVGALLLRREARMSDLRRNLPAWYLRHPGALARRLGSTLAHGFANHYVTLACRRPG